MEGENVISQEIFAEQNAKIAQLESDLATEKEAHLSTQQLNEGFQKKIEELELSGAKVKKLAAENAGKVPTKSFKVDKIDYVITVPAFHYKGSKITAEQLLADKDMQAELVAENVGIIKRKGDK